MEAKKQKGLNTKKVFRALPPPKIEDLSPPEKHQPVEKGEDLDPATCPMQLVEIGTRSFVTDLISSKVSKEDAESALKLLVPFSQLGENIHEVFRARIKTAVDDALRAGAVISFVNNLITLL